VANGVYVVLEGNGETPLADIVTAAEGLSVASKAP
jgi:hypothetical protein